MQGDAVGSFEEVRNGDVVGCVLYKEGVVILTTDQQMGSDFTADFEYLSYNNRTNTTTTTNDVGSISWTTFGLGLPQGGNALSLEHDTFSTAHQSASYSLDFAGTHKIPTVTMLAHANRGELNYTNNPTYIVHGEGTGSYHPITSSYYYKEVAKPIKNIHSASYSDPSGSLKKTTYITKVGIYDDKKKLIGIASVAKPVKKTEERDLTFKLKLDI